MGALGTTAGTGEEVFYSEIHQALYEYIEDAKGEDDNFDMRKAPQSRWNAALMYIYKTVFKGTKKLKESNYQENNIKGNQVIKTNNNKYNLDLVNTVCDIYINLCMEYSKEVSIMGFSYLTKITNDAIYAWAGVSTAENWSNCASPSRTGMDIYKKLTTNREESLSDKLVSGQANPVGILGVLNRHYGWNMGQPRTIERRESTQSPEQIAERYGQQLPIEGQAD